MLNATHSRGQPRSRSAKWITEYRINWVKKIWVNIAVRVFCLFVSLSHAQGQFQPFWEIKVRESYFCKECVTVSSLCFFIMLVYYITQDLTYEWWHRLYIIYPTYEHLWICPIPHKYIGNYCDRVEYVKLSLQAVVTFFMPLVSIVFY